MESIKNRDRKSNRFVLCFRPVDMEDGGSVKTVGKKVGAGDPLLASYNAADSVGNNKGPMIPVTSSVLSNDRLKVTDEVVAGKRKKTKFARIMKAILFETSLAKKLRKKRSQKNSYRSTSNLSTNSEKTSNSTYEKSTSDEDSDNRRTNSTLGPSNSSSIASSSRTMSEWKASFGSNSTELKQREDNGWNYGLCLLLVSMLVLILWGKVCAIFCTSAWIFFVARRSIGHSALEIGVGLPEVDSVEHNKRVIMEGLLGRNRARVL